MPDTDRAEVLTLDEENELYGWGILNVQQNEFCAPLGHGPLGNDADLFQTKEDALEHFEKLSEDMDSVSHLRIVKVHLANEADAEAIHTH